jgi:hypothetical protein
MGPLARAAGIGLEDQAALERGLQHAAHRVVDDPVAKGRGTDGAALGIADLEGVAQPGDGLFGLRCEVLVPLRFPSRAWEPGVRSPWPD